MITTAMPLAELTRSAIHLLCREMGVVNTARFLNQYSLGFGNYTEEREALFGNLPVEAIADEIQRQRQSRTP
jgi:hypothetical protein